MIHEKELRKKAEELLRKKRKELEMHIVDDPQKLVEELKIYQIELEIQNEELRDSNLEIEMVRDRFVNFFEKSPVGFLVLSSKGIILNVNERLCGLLDYEKSEMLKVPLFGFIYQDDQPEFLGRYKALFKSPEGKKLNLRLLKKDDSVLYADLIGGKDVFFADINDEAEQEVLLLSVIDVSQEVAARAERLESEKRFATLFNQSALGIAEVAPDGTFNNINRRFADIIGYDPDELLEQNFRELTYVEDLYLDEELISEVLEGTRDSFVIEKRFVHKDGYPVWTRLYSNAVRDSFGKPRYAIASLADITEERANILELKETNKKLKLAMNSARQGMWEWNLKTGKAVFDENALSMLGYERHFQRPGSWWIEQIHPDDKNNMTANLNDYLEGRIDRYRVEFRLLAKDGSYHWVLSQGIITRRDEEDQPLIFIGIHTDISENKAQIEKLREYAYIFDSIQEPISIIDRDFRYKKVNKAYQKIYDLPLEEIEGHSVEEMMSTQIFEKDIKSHLNRCLQGEVVHYQRWFDVSGNDPFYHDVKYFPYYDKAGEITRIVVSSRDMTAFKQAENKAKSTENLLEQMFNVSVPLWLISKDYEILRVNDTFCRIFQFNKEDIIGKKCFDIWQGPLCGSKECMLQQILKGESHYCHAVDRIQNDGGSMSCIVNSHAIYDENGEVFGIIENFTDISYLKEAQKELQLKNEEISCQNEELRNQNDELVNVREKQRQIIERLQETEEMLNESKERYRLLSEVTFEGILIHKNGELIDANQRLFDMMGYQFADMADVNLLNIVLEEDLALVKENLHKEYAAPYRIRARKKNGEVIKVEMEARNISHEGDKIRIVAVRDITARVKMEKALARSQNKFRFYIDSAPNGFFATDEEGNFIEINRALCQMTGYSQKELLSMSIPDILHPGSIKEGLDHYSKLARQDQVISEIKYIRKDGEERIWQETGKKLEDGSYIAFTVDATERIIAQEKLAERERLLNFAIEQLPIPVIIADAPAGNITHYNQAVIDLLVEKSPINKIRLSEQRRFWPTYYPDGSPYDIKDLPLTQAITQGKVTRNREIIIKHPDGDRWVLTNAAPLKNEKGEIIAGIVVFPEITEKKKIENAIKEQEKLLNEVGRIARIGGWEFDMETGKATWTKGTYDIVEIPYGKYIPNIHEHTDYYLAEYRDMIKKKMTELTEQGTALDFEAEFVTEKGNIKWGKVIGFREMSNDKCLRAYGTIQDITEQKELEKAIKEKQAQMNSLMNNATDLILLSDKDGKPLLFNEAYKNVIKRGLDLEVKPGDPPHRHLETPQKIEFWEKLHSRVLSGESFKIEYSLNFLDGSFHYLEVSYNPVLENGVVQGFSEITRDITDRKLQELELRESEEKYRILAETHQNIILTHDMDGIITYINPFGADYIGKPAADIIGVSIDTLLTEKERKKRTEILWNTFMKGIKSQQIFEIEYIDSENNPQTLEVTASPILKDDNPQAILVVARDITQRKKIEKELKMHREQLEELVEERTRKLKQQTEHLERMNKLFVGRELRMKQLKDNMNKLKVIIKEHNIDIDINEYEIPPEEV